MLQQAFQAFQAGKFAQAQALTREILEQFPDQEAGLLLLAMCLDVQGRSVEAIDVFERLVALFPQTAAHWTNLGNARRTMGFQSGAREALEQALVLQPDGIDALRSLGQLCLDSGTYQTARTYLLKAFEIDAADPTLRADAVRACFECGDQENAELLLANWDQWAGRDAMTLSDIAWIFARIGDNAEAGKALDAADAISPGHPRVIARRAALYERSNRVTEAQQLLDRIDAPTAKSQGIGEELAIIRAQIAARGTDIQAACKQYEDLLSEPTLQKRHPHLLFSLARLYDSMGNPAQAMEWLNRGHAAQVHQIQAHDADLLKPDADPLETTRLRTTHEAHAAWKALQAPSAAESPVFIVGFPRSGTTLMETALDAHPDLVAMDERSFLQDVVKTMRGFGLDYPNSLGELDDDTASRLRNTYWRLVKTRARIDMTGKRLVDKNPLNMLRLPMLARLFPNSPIILALRHPCDVVISNYMHMFHAPPYAAMCASIESTARGYASAFDFWLDQVALLKPRILEVRLEDVVDDITAQSRRIADFLGIAWNEKMVNFQDRARERGFIATPSYHQVVEPINRKGIGRWEQYREHMGTALPHLQPYLERWSYTA